MENEYYLRDCCENFVLKKHSLIVASYPSVIVFGEIANGTKFNNLKYFKFKTFEAKLLLETIGQIVVFFNGENELTKTNFFNDPVKEIDYIWQGNYLRKKDNNITKTVTLTVESKKVETFSVSFNLEGMNNLIYLIKRCLISSLCLKDVEEHFITEVIKLTEDVILSCKNNPSTAENVVNCFLSENCYKNAFKTSFYKEILAYYNDIILVLKDLSLLWFNENEVQ
jgi:hypothetical protein